MERQNKYVYCNDVNIFSLFGVLKKQFFFSTHPKTYFTQHSSLRYSIQLQLYTFSNMLHLLPDTIQVCLSVVNAINLLSQLTTLLILTKLVISSVGELSIYLSTFSSCNFLFAFCSMFSMYMPCRYIPLPLPFTMKYKVDCSHSVLRSTVVILHSTIRILVHCAT